MCISNYTKRCMCFLSPLLLMALGLFVMGAWLFKWPPLLTVVPEAVPMQFNTALCIFISGVCVWLLYRKDTVYHAILGVVPGLIGFLTLWQYYNDINFGIDEMFVKHFITDNTSSPGRMAPNTALCFCLATVAFTHIAKRAWSLLASGIIFSAGLFSVAGYILEAKRLYAWSPSVTEMAVHTGFAMLVLGASLILCIFTNGQPTKGENHDK